MAKRIGILTAGGDCPGLNAVVRASAKSALQWGWQVVGFRDGFAGLVENRFIEMDDACVSGILARGGTILGSNNSANPFAYTIAPYGSPDKPEDLSGRAIEVFNRHNLDALIAIGGDGTLSMALKFFQKGLPVIGVPKTIDNDLAATDVTFGFDSALTVATEAVDRVHTTAESHHRIIVVETMGRYAGWIALRSGISGGGDVILIPEIPYSPDKLCEAILNRRKRGKNYSIVVASEGAKTLDGKMTVRQTVPGSTDPIRLGGVGYTIADYIEKGCKLETRVVVLGHVQRGGIPTAYDRWLATRFGYHASLLVAQEKFGNMVSLKGQDITEVPIEAAVKNLRLVDPDGEEVRVAMGVGTSFGI